MSSLKVRGDAIADRKLSFLKPSLTVDWQPGNDWHFQLIARRTVAQLDFYDFVSAAELSNDRVNGGNANLLPQQTWEGRFVAEHPLFKTGTVRFEAGADIVSQLQDRILVFDDKGKGFDAPGNIGTGKRYFADLTIDAPLDMLWSGLRVRAHALVQRTRVQTGMGEIATSATSSGLVVGRSVAAMPAMAYGFNLNDRDRTFSFRTDQIDAVPTSGSTASLRRISATPRSSFILDVENSPTPAFCAAPVLFPNRTDPVRTMTRFAIAMAIPRQLS